MIFTIFKILVQHVNMLISNVHKVHLKYWENPRDISLKSRNVTNMVWH